MNFTEMKKVLIDAARKAGVEEYEIYFQQNESIGAETLKKEINSFSSSVGGGVCFRCIVNGRMGYASGELLNADAMYELVERAVANAACIDSEDEVFLFKGSEHYEKGGLLSAELVDAATVRRRALQLQEAVYAESDQVAEGTQSAAFSETVSIDLYNSHGLSLQNRTLLSGVYTEVIVRKEDEAAEQFSFALSKEESPSLADFAHLSKEAVTEALEKLGAGEVESGKYDILIDGRQFRSVLSAFSGIFSAKSAQLGLSLLAGKEGEKIASDCVTILDDPMPSDSAVQAPFDGEGVATERKAVVENGVLKTLLYDLSTAKKAGVASTANGQRASYASAVAIAPYHFSIVGGSLSKEELYQRLGDGILITECKGLHAGANSVTGDFSIESAGFRIRNGKRAEPIKGFTIAGNFFDLLKQIDCLGKDVSWGIPSGFTCFGSPDVLVRGVGIAGK